MFDCFCYLFVTLPNLPAKIRHVRLPFTFNAIASRESDIYHFDIFSLFSHLRIDTKMHTHTLTHTPLSQSKIQIAKRHRKHYSFLRTCAPLMFIFSVFLLISLMYWLYFDLREQLSDHRSKIEQGDSMFSSVDNIL